MFRATRRWTISALVLLPLVMTASIAPSGYGLAQVEDPDGPDFNGDGYADLAIGGSGIPECSDTRLGVVDVLFGSVGGPEPDAMITLSPCNDGAGNGGRRGHYGSELATGDFDGDGFDDLVIGLPWRSKGRRRQAGGFTVVHGAPGGFDTSRSQHVTRSTPGVTGPARWGDRFGGEMTSGDFDGDGYDDLVVAMPRADVRGRRTAGLVMVFPGSPAGLDPATSQPWRRHSRDDFGRVDGPLRVGEHFGRAVAAADFDDDGTDDLAISGPYAGANHGGTVHVLMGMPGVGLTTDRQQAWDQDTDTGVPGGRINNKAEYFDFFGGSLATGDIDCDGVDDLVVGVTREDVADRRDAGAVQVIFGSGDGLTVFGDQFRAMIQMGFDWPYTGPRTTVGNPRLPYWSQSIAVGDLDGDNCDDIVAAAPGGSVLDPIGNAVEYAGWLAVISGTPDGADTTATLWHQNSADEYGVVPDEAEEREWFGVNVSILDGDADGYADVAASATGEVLSDVGMRGAVHLFFGSDEGVTTRDAILIDNVARTDNGESLWGFLP